jgi:hypothetical protein
MIFKKYIPVFWLALALAMIGLMLLAWTPLPMQAGPELPSRATPTPVPRPDDNDDDKDNKRLGAYIELQPQGAPNGAWAVVQWQDSAGDWHDVEGWQGPLDGGPEKWWVSQGDFGKGPFQWTVYQEQKGELLATSAPFYLPGTASQLVRVKVSIVP